jgi:hypothetical protein
MKSVMASSRPSAANSAPDKPQSLSLEQAPIDVVAAARNGLPGRWSRAAYWSVFALGLIWTAQLCLRSTGASLDDEIGHYLLSRDSFRFPQNLLDVWGRPVNTLIYALPAQFGWLGARLFSLLLSAATVVFTTRLAALVGARFLFLVPALLWFQPWFANLGYTVITEVPFTLWLTAGTYFWAAGRYTTASCFLGLLPLTRHEGIALTGLWVVYMLFRRNWKAAAVAAFPMLAFQLLHLAFAGAQGYAIYLQPHPTDQYGQGDWLHFVRPLRWDVGAPVVILAIVGFFSSYWLKGRRRFFTGFLIYFMIHAVIYRFGLFASGGYSLFLLPIAPAFAVAGALGLEKITAQCERVWARMVPGVSIPHRVIALGVAMVAAVVIAYGMRKPPQLLGDEAFALQQASAWLKEAGLGSRPTVATNVNFYYFHALRVGPGSYWWVVPKLTGLTKGTIVVWDRHYSSVSGLPLSDLTASDNGWRRLASFGTDEFTVIFEKLGPATMPNKEGER